MPQGKKFNRLAQSEQGKVMSKQIKERVAGTNHTSTDAENSPQPEPKGKYYGDGPSTTRANKPGVRKGNESAQK
jgi:hypothetical protein